MGRGPTNKNNPGTAVGAGSDRLSDNVGFIIKGIGTQPLLTRQEEIEIAKNRDLARDRAIGHLLRSVYCKSRIVNLLENLSNGKGRFDAIVGLPCEGEKEKAASNQLLSTNIKPLKVLLKKEGDILAKRLSKRAGAELDLEQEQKNLKRIDAKFLQLIKECRLKPERIFALAGDFNEFAEHVSSIEKRSRELRDPTGFQQRNNQGLEEFVERTLKSRLEIGFLRAKLAKLDKAQEPQRAQALEKVLDFDDRLRGLLEELKWVRLNKSTFDTHQEQQQKIEEAESNLKELVSQFGEISANRPVTRKDELSAARYALLHAYNRLGTSGDKALNLLEIYRGSIKEYHEARNLLVVPNKRLVVSIAKKYQNRGLPLEDLIAAGQDGLLKAAEKFDPLFFVKFSTYATWWIRRGMVMAVYEHENRFGLSAHNKPILRKLKARLAQELGCIPSQEEVLVAWMNKRPGNVQRRAGASKEQAYQKDIQALEQGADTHFSLEMRPGSKSSGEIEKWDIASLEKSVSENSEEKERQQAVLNLTQKALGLVDSREARILRMRFGIGEDPQTLECVGEILGVSRERVRQIERKALKKVQFFLGEGEKVLSTVGGLPKVPKVRRREALVQKAQGHTTSSPDSTTTTQSPPSTESSEVPSSIS